MQGPAFPAEPGALVEALLEWSVGAKATDLHLAPHSKGCLIRVRVDGLLRDLHELDGELFPKVASRIKVLGEMDIVEKRRPQDGRFTVVVEDRAVDFRVSCVPTLYGESLVIRILDRMAGFRTIDQLGLGSVELRLFRSLISQPNGLIVVTGPTGVGKTTTLYAALQELSVPECHVLTIEDPIEYEVPRVAQIAVQHRLGNTFAGLLRSILRHDPDVIMVGEVRDAETAEVSVRAALTGHLVLTTLHTERAAHAITAFLNFGLKPYALAPALRGIVAQRLIREICPGCKKSFEYGEKVLDDPDFAGVLREGEKPSFSMGLGCPSCFQSGYRGRRAIFEVLEVGEMIRQRILESANAEEIERCAERAGMVTLRKNGFRAVMEGVTTVEEVVRAMYIE